MAVYLIDEAVLQTGIVTTILGFGTVFFILCIISFVLYVFGKIMVKFAKKEPEKPQVMPVQAKAEKTIEESVPDEVSIKDDKELIAVITAAIAASMGGNVTPDKLVVRSLKRVRASSWKNEAIYEQQLNEL